MQNLKKIDVEHRRWAKKLECFRQESALLKYRLSEMVDNDAENRFLQKAEYLQNELLLKDEMLKKLLKEVQDYINLIENKLHLTKKIIAMHDKLQKDISKFEEHFILLTKEFSEQMFQNL